MTEGASGMLARLQAVEKGLEKKVSEELHVSEYGRLVEKIDSSNANVNIRFDSQDKRLMALENHSTWQTRYSIGTLLTALSAVIWYVLTH